MSEDKKQEVGVDVTFCDNCGMGYPDNLESCPACGEWKGD